MRVLITGIEGFVGGYLSQLFLSKRDEVIGTYYDENILKRQYSNKIILHNLNITDNQEMNLLLKKYKPDIIYHLAAQSSVSYSWENPQETMSINVNGTINLLKGVAKFSIQSKVILIGSSEQYGKVTKEELPISEEQPLKPTNPYAISKVTQELIANLYYTSKHLKIIKIRSFNHTGPRQATTFVLPDFAKQIVDIERNIIPPIIRTGNLQVKRDFSDVRDIVKAYKLLGDKGVIGETYNVGSGNSYLLQELLDYMIAQSKVEIIIKQDRKKIRPIENLEIICDNSKLKKLGWKNTIPITQTINDIIKYYREKINL